MNISKRYKRCPCWKIAVTATRRAFAAHQGFKTLNQRIALGETVKPSNGTVRFDLTVHLSGGYWCT